MTDKLELGNVNHGEYASYKNTYSSVRIELLNISPGQLDKFLALVRAFCKDPISAVEMDEAAAGVESIDFKTHKRVEYPKAKPESKPRHLEFESEIIELLRDNPKTKQFIVSRLLEGVSSNNMRYATFFRTWLALASKGIIVPKEREDPNTLWSYMED